MSLISCYRCNFMALDCYRSFSLAFFVSTPIVSVSFFVLLWIFCFLHHFTDDDLANSLVSFFNDRACVLCLQVLTYWTVNNIKWNVYYFVCVLSAIKMNLLLCFEFSEQNNIVRVHWKLDDRVLLWQKSSTMKNSEFRYELLWLQNVNTFQRFSIYLCKVKIF